MMIGSELIRKKNISNELNQNLIKKIFYKIDELTQEELSNILIFKEGFNWKSSLLPILKGEETKNWKDFVFSEIDYSFNEARKILNLGASDARAFMIRNNEWKYIYYKGFEPQLFDLKNDPDEFNDLGRSKDHSKIREEMKELLLKRIIDRKNRIAATDEFVTKERDYTKDDGIMIGVW